MHIECLVNFQISRETKRSLHLKTFVRQTRRKEVKTALKIIHKERKGTLKCRLELCSVTYVGARIWRTAKENEEEIAAPASVSNLLIKHSYDLRLNTERSFNSNATGQLIVDSANGHREEGKWRRLNVTPCLVFVPCYRNVAAWSVNCKKPGGINAPLSNYAACNRNVDEGHATRIRHWRRNENCDCLKLECGVTYTVVTISISSRTKIADYCQRLLIIKNLESHEKCKSLILDEELRMHSLLFNVMLCVSRFSKYFIIDCKIICTRLELFIRVFKGLIHVLKQIINPYLKKKKKIVFYSLVTNQTF